MKLYFEEYGYPIDKLRENLGDNILLHPLQEGKAKVSYVGYFFNSEINDTVFILPKVFISENKWAFDIEGCNPEEIIDLSPETNPLKTNSYDEVVFELSMWLYQAICHFYERKSQSSIGSDVEILNVRPMGEKMSKTIIEIILSLRGFQKKHKNLFTYISLVNSIGNNKVHWNKTISKVQPVFKDKKPFYLEFKNKSKVINFDEELVALFYSVLNYISQTYHFKTQIVNGYAILKSSKIKTMIESGKGTRLLKKIRHNYFTDELVELWNLLYEFFARAEMIGSGKAYQEKLLVSNFNLVFEDMIDQLISDKDLPKELKEQPDGKIVDHIYKNPSLIEEDKDIYFIGDSKYYKGTTGLGDNSIYKQFTYAKNVIQYNINLFNSEKNLNNCRYRDPLTEGYNITPNFFIRGNIDFKNPKSQELNLQLNKVSKDDIPPNKHFENRLFDRDTLYLQTYNINFMFVVASYVKNSDDMALKKSIQDLFRHNFIDFIEKKFEFYVLEPKRGDLASAVERNFKLLNGKIYQPSDSSNLLILALDLDIDYQLENSQLLFRIDSDFYVYEYHLGTNPNDVKKDDKSPYCIMPVSMVAESPEVAKAKDEDTKLQEKYKKYKNPSVLFGIYKDAAHLKWIMKNKKYNVRFDDRVGAVRHTCQVTSAEYLVLYEFGKEDKYKVYKLGGKHYIWDAKKMKETGYEIKEGGDANKYYLYEILSETTELGEIDFNSILEKPRDVFRKSGMSEDDVNGTPIYVYKYELNNHLK